MQKVLQYFILLALLCGCNNSTAIDDDESSDREYKKAIQLVQEGRDGEALTNFLRIIYKKKIAPKSHLYAGKIYLDIYNDPIYAIYHFRECILQNHDSKESAIVSQLIDTAKKAFIKNLPGHGSELDTHVELIEITKRLREENISLKRMLKEVQDRCKALEMRRANDVRILPTHSTVSKKGRYLHVVKPGDTLSKISQKYYGSSAWWKKIFEANQDQIPYPNALTVGQELIIP